MNCSPHGHLNWESNVETFHYSTKTSTAPRKFSTILSVSTVYIIMQFRRDRMLFGVRSVAARGRGLCPGWKRPGPGCAPVDEMGQNLRVKNVPQSKFGCPSCAPAVEKFWRRHCVRWQRFRAALQHLFIAHNNSV
jgi:hypothetical protein